MATLWACLTVAAAPAATILGTVTDSSTGQPIENALVLLVDLAGGAPDTNFTNAAGAFLFDGKETSLYTITISALGYYGDSATATPIPFLDPDPAIDFALDPRQAGTATIEGKITDAQTGDPILFAVVEAYDSNHPNSPADIATNLPLVGYTLSNLAVETYRARAWAHGYIAAEQTDIILTDGATQTGIDIVLAPGKASISGAVHARGTLEPLESVVVTAVDASTRPVGSDATSSTGGYALEGLGEGTLLVTALHAGYQVGSKTVLLLGAEEHRADVDFLLEDESEPRAPALLRAAWSDPPTTVTLYWTTSVDESPILGHGDVIEYRLYRAGAAEGPFARVDTIEADGSVAYSSRDANVTYPTTLFYVIRAWDGSFESPDSPVASPLTSEKPFKAGGFLVY